MRRPRKFGAAARPRWRAGGPGRRRMGGWVCIDSSRDADDPHERPARSGPCRDPRLASPSRCARFRMQRVAV